MSKKNGTTTPKQTAAQPATVPTKKITKPGPDAPVTRTEAPHAPIGAAPKRRGRPTGSAAELAPHSPAGATQPGLAPAETDEGELVVFALRIEREHRDRLHEVVGSGKASRFVRALIIEASRGDADAVVRLITEVHARPR